MCYDDYLVDEDNTEIVVAENNESTASASLPAKKFRQKTPFIERIAKLGI